MEVKTYPLNNQSITVSFGHEINSKIHKMVKSYYQWLQDQKYDFIIDIVPTYTNVTIYFNPGLINYDEIESRLLQDVNSIELANNNARRVIHIPVYYNGDDLERVAKHNRLSIDQVINLHISRRYLVYMIGFLPGFPYLGGMDDRLATPRLQTPRTQVDPGSVGIANQQTGVYPISSPGGWNIIGHSPVKLFDQKRENPFLVQIGDYIQFYSISCEEYERFTSQSNPTVEWLTDED